MLIPVSFFSIHFFPISFRLPQTKPSTTGGREGEGGTEGRGGKGGPGGSGGASKYWTETHTRYVNGQPQSYTTTHRQPGGSSGLPGRHGIAGARGSNGVSGTDGRFLITCEGQGSFEWRYDLELMDDIQVLDQHQYGILEPGCRFHITYSVANFGGMPSPAYQDVVATVLPSPSVHIADSQDPLGSGFVALPRSIEPGQKGRLPAPINAFLTDLSHTPIGPPCNDLAKLEHQATVLRVNQTCPLVDAQQTTINVSFPLELSYPYGTVCVSAGTEAFLVVDVRNISHKPIGVRAPLCRAANVRCSTLGSERGPTSDENGKVLSEAIKEARSVPDSKFLASENFEIALLHNDSATWANSDDGVFQNIDILDPGCVTKVPCSVRVLPRSGKKNKYGEYYYAQACLQTVLELGHPLNFASIRPIQLRPFQVQVAERFRYVPNDTRVLLICNNRTLAKEVDEWRKMVSEILGIPNGSNDDLCSVWNLSLYDGVSLKYRPWSQDFQNDKENSKLSSLAKLFSGDDRVIVFLNNPCTPSSIRVDNNEVCPLPFVHRQEFLQACRDERCRIYVFGSPVGVDLRSRLLIPVDATVRREFVNEKSLFENAIETLRPLFDSGTKSPDSKIDETTSASMHSDMKGILLKKKQKGNRYVKRYFTLNAEAGTLSYFKTALAKTAQAVFKLSECSNIELVEAEDGGEDELKFHTGTRELHLKRAPNSDESLLQEWHQKLIENAALNGSMSRGGDEQPKAEYGSDYYCSYQVVLRKLGVQELRIKQTADCLASKLHMKYPECNWLVVYKHVPKNEQQRNRGIGFNARNIGEIQVHLGTLHSDGNALWHGISDDEAQASHLVHTGVSSTENRYAFMKSLSIGTKLRVLRECDQNGGFPGMQSSEGKASLALLIDAIASDVADENARFRFGVLGTGKKLSNLLNGKKRRSEVDMWISRMKILAAVTAKENFGHVEMDTVKYNEIFRLIVTIRLLVQKGIARHMSALRVSRVGMISRASSVSLDSMEKHFAAAIGVEKLNELKNSEGQTIAKAVQAMSKKGSEEGEKRVQRKELLSHLRFKHGVGIEGLNTENGEFAPLVIEMSEFEAAQIAERNYTAEGIDEKRGIYASDNERREAMNAFIQAHISVFNDS